MTRRILLISDIHGNYPALTAIHEHCNGRGFDAVINCGDSLVYAPFPNETLSWLRRHATVNILGNTDKKVIKLLMKKAIKKPTSAEKRIMYEATATALTKQNSLFLQSFKKKSSYTVLESKGGRNQELVIGIFHGSPAANHEFLFDTTETSRFLQLAATCKTDVVVTGHSHTPYHKKIGGVHFINPGSVGRMFDGDPRASCAILEVSAATVAVQHFRIDYDIEAVVRALAKKQLPEIYARMYLKGCKLN